MKSLIKIFFMVLILVSFKSFVYGDDCTINYDNDCLSPSYIDKEMKGYSIGIGVWYGYCEIKCADKTTFKPIRLKNEEFEFFGKDKNHVFFRLDALKGINPNNYKIKETGEPNYYLIYDKDTVYLNTILFPQIDPATFEFMDTSYENWESWFKDKNHVYRLTNTGNSLENKLEILSDSDPAFFTFGYNITPSTVYWYGKKIEGADVGSMELLHFGFAKDKNNVFFEGKIVYGADVRSFVETAVGDVNYYVDKNGFFGDDDGQHYLTIPYMNKEYPKDAKITQKSISTAIKTYETKYPNYTPQPAMPKLGSPEEQELKKFQEEVARAKLEEAEENKQNMIKLSIGIVSVLGLGGIVYGVMRWKKRKK